MIRRSTRLKWHHRFRRLSHESAGLVCLAALFLLAGCFSLRTAAMTPANLRYITVKTDNVFQEVTAQFRRRLHAVGINTRQRAISTITLRLHDSTPHTEVPVIFDSLQGTVYRYRISLGLEITCRNGHVLRDTTLYATQDILHNINQVSPPVLTPLMRRALIQRLVDSTINLVTSKALSQEVSEQCQPSPSHSSLASPSKPST